MVRFTARMKTSGRYTHCGKPMESIHIEDDESTVTLKCVGCGHTEEVDYYSWDNWSPWE